MCIIDYIPFSKTDFLINIWLNLDHGAVLLFFKWTCCLATISWFNKNKHHIVTVQTTPSQQTHCHTRAPVPLPQASNQILSLGDVATCHPLETSADNSNWLCCHYLGLLYSCLYPGREIHDTHSFKAVDFVWVLLTDILHYLWAFHNQAHPRGRTRLAALWQSAAEWKAKRYNFLKERSLV